MAITTEAGLQTSLLDGKKIRFIKQGITGATTGGFYTTWRVAGQPSAGGTPTTTGTALTRTSAGALPIPAASGTSYLVEWECSSARGQQVGLLADRLVEFGGLVGNVTSAQTVSALALPSRATSATDVELWLEFYSTAGTTASATVTASYTNQSGTAARTATLIGGIPASGTGVNRCYPFALQAGDTGVQSVQSVTLGTSTGTAGNMGLVLRRTLVMGYMPMAQLGFYQTWAELDMQQVGDDAALELLSLTGNSNTAEFFGSIRLAQG